MKIKDKKERERILERIREEEIRLQPNGDGSQMSMQSPKLADAPGTK